MTLRELLLCAVEILQKAEIDSPKVDASLLIEAAIEISERDFRMHKDVEISKENEALALSYVDRRAKGEPTQYITGYWEFFGEKFFVGKGVLIPRDDTEVVLRASIDYLRTLDKKNPTILDICSGSGILAITLKKLFPNAQVSAIEISEDALVYLNKNKDFHNADINVIEGDLFEVYSQFENEYFDLIISNPPYITKEDMKTLSNEVLHEPELALYGGEDGCDFIRGIVSLYTSKLKNGGMLSLELDSDEAPYSTALMKQNGFEDTKIFDDLGGIHRAVTGVRRK